MNLPYFIEDLINETCEFFKYITFGLIFTAVVCLIPAGLIYSLRETPEQTKVVYDAWCKLNYREDITIDEWKTLRNSHLLQNEAKFRAEQ